MQTFGNMGFGGDLQYDTNLSINSSVGGVYSSQSGFSPLNKFEIKSSRGTGLKGRKGNFKIGAGAVFKHHKSNLTGLLASL